jgi:uncharacterized membrane protein YbhN (UPF0104 family)
VARTEAAGFAPVAASVLVERAVDLMALALVAAVALAPIAIAWAFAFACLGASVFVVLALGRRAPALARLVPARMPGRIKDAVRAFLGAVAATPNAVIGFVSALSVLAWIGDAVVVLIVARALDVEIAPVGALAIGLGGALGTALPAAPGYLATYELGAVTLGSIAAIPSDVVAPIALLTHLLGVGALAIAGAISLGAVGGKLAISPDVELPSVELPVSPRAPDPSSRGSHG